MKKCTIIRVLCMIYSVQSYLVKNFYLYNFRVKILDAFTLEFYSKFFTSYTNIFTRLKFFTVYDSKLKFDLHIESIKNQALRNLGFLIRQSYYLKNIQSLKILYNAFVKSKLEYASVVWNPINIGPKQILEKVQNRFLRYLYYKKYNIYPNYLIIRTTALREEFEIPSLEAARNCSLLIFGFKIFNNLINDSKLLSFLNLKVPSRPTRSASLFYVPFSSLSRRSPINTFLKLANEVSVLTDIDFAQTHRSFVKELRQHFLVTAPT